MVLLVEVLSSDWTSPLPVGFEVMYKENAKTKKTPKKVKSRDSNMLTCTGEESSWEAIKR